MIWIIDSKFGNVGSLSVSTGRDGYFDSRLTHTLTEEGIVLRNLMFSVDSKNSLRKHMNENARFIKKDKTGNHRLFKFLKKSEESGDMSTLTVEAEDMGYELLRYQVRPIKTKFMSAKTAFQEALAKTGIQIQRCDVTSIKEVRIDEDETVVQRIGKLNEIFGVEVEFGVNMKSSRYLNTYINIQKKIGTDKGKQFVYPGNVISIIKDVSMDTMVNRMYCYGNSDDDKEVGIAGLSLSKSKGGFIDKEKHTPYIEHKESIQKYGVYEATFTYGTSDKLELAKRGYNEMIDFVEPEILYTLTGAGLQNEFVGDIVSIINKDFPTESNVKQRVTGVVESDTEFEESIQIGYPKLKSNKLRIDVKALKEDARKGNAGSVGSEKFSDYIIPGERVSEDSFTFDFSKVKEPDLFENFMHQTFYVPDDGQYAVATNSWSSTFTIGDMSEVNDATVFEGSHNFYTVTPWGKTIFRKGPLIVGEMDAGLRHIDNEAIYCIEGSLPRAGHADGRTSYFNLDTNESLTLRRGKFYMLSFDVRVFSNGQFFAPELMTGSINGHFLRAQDTPSGSGYLMEGKEDGEWHTFNFVISPHDAGFAPLHTRKHSLPATINSSYTERDSIQFENTNGVDVLTKYPSKSGTDSLSELLRPEYSSREQANESSFQYYLRLYTTTTFPGLPDRNLNEQTDINFRRLKIQEIDEDYDQPGVYKAGDDLYLQTDGKARVTETGIASPSLAYRTIVAQDFETASSERFKTNIEPVRDYLNLIEEMKKLDVKMYNMKADLAKGIHRKKIGIINEEAPDFLKGDDTVLLYDMLAFSIATTQDVITRLELAEDRLAWLEMQ